jgi:hypothetical protein
MDLQIADAILAVDRGNIPAAESLLDDCITQSGDSEELRDSALLRCASARPSPKCGAIGIWR